MSAIEGLCGVSLHQTHLKINNDTQYVMTEREIWHECHGCMSESEPFNVYGALVSNKSRLHNLFEV
jgi:hypothetical protein